MSPRWRTGPAVSGRRTSDSRPGATGWPAPTGGRARGRRSPRSAGPITAIASTLITSQTPVPSPSPRIGSRLPGGLLAGDRRVGNRPHPDGEPDAETDAQPDGEVDRPEMQREIANEIAGAMTPAGPDRGAEQAEPDRQYPHQQGRAAALEAGELQRRRDQQAQQQHSAETGEDVDERPGRLGETDRGRRRTTAIGWVGGSSGCWINAVTCWIKWQCRIKTAVPDQVRCSVERRCGIGKAHGLHGARVESGGRSLDSASACVNSASHWREPVASRHQLDGDLLEPTGREGRDVDRDRAATAGRPAAVRRPPWPSRSPAASRRARRGCRPPRLRPTATTTGKCLHRVDLHDQVERSDPVRRQVEQVGGSIVDGRARMPIPGDTHCGLGDVEGDRPKSVSAPGIPRRHPSPQPTTTADRPPPASSAACAHCSSNGFGVSRSQGMVTVPCSAAP